MAHTTTSEKRKKLLTELVDGEMPRLWCPALTHYANGNLDIDRMNAHWAAMRPTVRAFLVPGSTGDGWEMNHDEKEVLLDVVIHLARQLDALLLVGVLQADVTAMCQVIVETMTRLKQQVGLENPLEVLKQSRICGFTICPPKGAHLTQNQIQSGLETVLKLDVPVAIYQLPQVTENEISPEILSRLAQKHSNFLIFKDSSGQDRFALKDKGQSGVYLLRGAEGHYAQWLQELGGPYQGLLLSTANCFSAQLKSIITLLEQGQSEEAKRLSDRMTQAVDQVFKQVSPLKIGNPFTNANKAMDHFMAYGLDATLMPPPMLHAGMSLPESVIQAVGTILKTARLIPQQGYLSEARLSSPQQREIANREIL